MTSCDISLETLLNFLEHRLAPVELQRVEKHLATDCARCTAQRSAYEVLLRQLSESRFEPPSLAALEEAKGLLRRRRPRTSAREWAARLVLPRSPQGLAVRDGEAEPLPLLFETEEHDIDLWAEPDGAESYYVIGQVRSRESGRAEVPLLVRLFSLSAPEQEQVILPDSVGEFHISALSAGRYAMVIGLATGTIRLDEVVLAGRT
jgi:hypothetical protein